MKNTHNIKILLMVGAIVTAAATPALAQPPQPPAAQVRAAMAKLAWLEGDWQGEGWRATRDGRETFYVDERVRFHLDGIVLVVEGRGWSVNEHGAEIEGHKALGVFSYDAFARTYRFDAFIKEGYQSRTTPEIGENEFRWTVPAGPGAEMRYHARLTEKGAWVETGERCAGDACAPALEMRLEKKPADE